MPRPQTVLATSYSVAGYPMSRLRRRNTRGTSCSVTVPNSVDFSRCSTPPPSSRYEHVTPMLDAFTGCGLRNAMISSYMAVFIYRYLHRLTPRYLSDYIQRVADFNRRRLRSSSSSQLVIRRTRLSTVGDRAFPVAGSRLWNSLPPPDATSSFTRFFWAASKLPM